MLSVVGILIVFICIISGFLMEKGQIGVLLQPAEFLIIIGAAIGTILTSNPVHLLKRIGQSLPKVVKGSGYTEQRYVETLKMLFDLLGKARKEGAIAIENDVEEPAKSAVFSRYPVFMADQHALEFVCDTLRMVITGGVTPLDLDQMMEVDMEARHHSASEPVHALATVADALPGLGIVAAVLGVVVTMGALGGPPEEIGRKVAAALVGTFMGILLCYGVVGPLSTKLAKCADEENSYYHVLRVVLLAFVKGTSPIMAVELGRRAIPDHCRPKFAEVETACRQKVVEVPMSKVAAQG
jgi:chemotaxis protein MotA